MNCEEIMTKDPVCCLASDTAQSAAQLMKDEDVGSIPVAQDKDLRQLIGIVTDRDLALRCVAEGRDGRTVLVQDVMTTGTISCRADDDVHKALAAMEEYKVRRIPVVGSKGELVGIIAQADIATRLENPDHIAEVVEEISKAQASNS